MSHVPLISSEVSEYIKKDIRFRGSKGVIDIARMMAELTIYTASHCLQGKEVRDSMDSTFAKLYHDLDLGFTPINFLIPWAPLPRNRRRDAARKKVAELFMGIIRARHQSATVANNLTEDMVWNLMTSVYKDGTPVPDREVAHMMIALLMAGQHSSSSVASWIMAHLAAEPQIMDELLHEQVQVLGTELPPLTYENIQLLKLNQYVIKETLRLHAPIHSVMRAVKSPMHVDGTPYTIPTSHTLLSAPGFTSRLPEYFPKPEVWNPYRWVEEDGGCERWGKGTSSPYLPFGAGRHRCIGEQFAYVQLGTILASIVRGFRFTNVAGLQGVGGTDYSVCAKGPCTLRVIVLQVQSLTLVSWALQSLFSKPLEPLLVQWERGSHDSTGG